MSIITRDNLHDRKLLNKTKKTCLIFNQFNHIYIMFASVFLPKEPKGPKHTSHDLFVIQI